jgi:hypothetical protein
MLVSPIGSIGTSPSVLTWSQVSGAGYYSLFLVDDTTGTTVIEKSNIAVNSYSPTVPLHLRHEYTWWVVATSTNHLFMVRSNRLSFTIT